MDMAAQMPCQPLSDLGMLVRRVVITDQMQILVLGRLAVNLAQETEPFDMAVTLGVTGNHGTIQRAHRREQRSRAVAFVVVGHRFPPSLLERQTGLGRSSPCT